MGDRTSTAETTINDLVERSVGDYLAAAFDRQGVGTGLSNQRLAVLVDQAQSQPGRTVQATVSNLVHRDTTINGATVQDILPSDLSDQFGVTPSLSGPAIDVATVAPLADAVSQVVDSPDRMVAAHWPQLGSIGGTITDSGTQKDALPSNATPTFTADGLEIRTHGAAIDVSLWVPMLAGEAGQLGEITSYLIAESWHFYEAHLRNMISTAAGAAEADLEAAIDAVGTPTLLVGGISQVLALPDRFEDRTGIDVRAAIGLGGEYVIDQRRWPVFHAEPIVLMAVEPERAGMVIGAAIRSAVVTPTDAVATW